MKKNVLLLTAIAVLCFVNLNAQSVELGVKAGVNFSDITGDDVSSFKGRTAFHIGAVAEIPVSDNFSVQPELLYSAQGSDWEEDFEGELIKGSVEADYINVPLMAKYYVAEGFSIEAGPQVGFLISAKDKYESVEEDIKDDLKGIDFGVNFGIGYKLENGFNLGARYNLGLIDVNDNPDYLGDSSYKNSVIQISVGYFF